MNRGVLILIVLALLAAVFWFGNAFFTGQNFDKTVLGIFSAKGVELDSMNFDQKGLSSLSKASLEELGSELEAVPAASEEQIAAKNALLSFVHLSLLEKQYFSVSSSISELSFSEYCAKLSWFNQRSDLGIQILSELNSFDGWAKKAGGKFGLQSFSSKQSLYESILGGQKSSVEELRTTCQSASFSP
ncbi:MAG: hypothetical protein V1777_00325 [Candidatus Micrarchaeota archaeon]